MSSFIKLERKIKDWEWYHDKNTKILFIDMLLEARWKDGTYKGVVIKRGSFASSVRKLAKENDLTDNEVRTALKHLQKTHEITCKSHSKFTVFTINNYDLYQTDNTQDNKEITNKSQAINKQLTNKSQTNHEQLTHSIEEERKNVKEEKEEKEKEECSKTLQGQNEKSKKPVYFPNDELLNEAFESFIEMRNKIKKPMTDRAIDLAIKKLKDFATIQSTGEMDNELAIKIINQSIFNNWQGLYELKDNNGWVNRNNTSRNNAGYDWDNI